MTSVRSALLAICLAAVAAPTQAAEIHLGISGLRSGQGALRVALFRTPADFPKPDGVFREEVVPAQPGNLDVVFTGVPPGTYAVAAFHDENDNGEFDRGLFGFPLEGFGFANDASVGLGPPAFDEAAIRLDGEPVRSGFSIRYWFGGPD